MFSLTPTRVFRRRPQSPPYRGAITEQIKGKRGRPGRRGRAIRPGSRGPAGRRTPLTSAGGTSKRRTVDSWRRRTRPAAATATPHPPGSGSSERRKRTRQLRSSTKINSKGGDRRRNASREMRRSRAWGAEV
ncbi:hypothetical protein Taro_034393 [Colocasia esculenta]|uniref:Uncharacterized protein n=1 Tax=Colocasia esculenta TaxID=4460 RepID=A0A843VXN7_COLES|nr:hypothetical protein [Colocasia esculenta]